jgi:hypothetical protein
MLASAGSCTAIPDMRRPASTCAGDCSRDSSLKNHAPRMVRFSRNDPSSRVELAFLQPQGSKNTVPSSGKNFIGVLPCASLLDQRLRSVIAQAREAISISHQRAAPPRAGRGQGRQLLAEIAAHVGHVREQPSRLRQWQTPGRESSLAARFGTVATPSCTHRSTIIGDALDAPHGAHDRLATLAAKLARMGIVEDPGRTLALHRTTDPDPERSIRRVCAGAMGGHGGSSER